MQELQRTIEDNTREAKVTIAALGRDEALATALAAVAYAADRINALEKRVEQLEQQVATKS